MAKDIVDVAIGEIDYAEQGKNRTKYGAWYGMNGAAWCHMFVSWCADQAGVSTSVVPKTASCSNGISFFKNKGKFQYRGKYTPKRGDIIYFRNGGHVGIVEKVTGNTVHTVEGNSSDKVRRKSYSLNDSNITGYGVPAYTNLNSSSSGAASEASKTELKYLKSILKKKKPVKTTIEGEIEESYDLPAGETEIIIQNGDNLFSLPVKDGMKVVWERKGTPGKLTFEAEYNKEFKTTEGNPVLLIVDGRKFFYGFIFKQSRTKDGWISYTVYDQLRYLKNKDTYVYKNKTADQVIKALAKRFNLKCGKLPDTSYKMSAAENDVELFTMIQNILDNTLMSKNQLYVLYDKCGSIQLSNVNSMKVDACLVDADTAEDYAYETSIDSDVYNQIKLVYENKTKGTYDLFVAKHTKNINKWGVLQYLEKIDTPDIGKLKAKAYLKLYNKKSRTLTIKNQIGSTKVIAGSMIPVMLNLGDIQVANYMMVEKVTHIFQNRRHTMDLIVSGGDFSG